MDEALKKLLSSEVFSEETKIKFTEAFKNAVKLAESNAEKRIRQELVTEFKSNEKALHEGMEKLLVREIEPHIAELKEGKSQIAAMKKSLAEKGAALEESLKTEYAKRSEALEEITESLIKKEMGELHGDVLTNRRAYLTAINEAKSQYARMGDELKKKTAYVLEMFLEKTVRGMMNELRDEIKAANEADFGREIFESFRNLFLRQHFNTDKETRALVSQLNSLKEENNKIKTVAKKRIAEAVQAETTARSAHKKLSESVALAQTRAKLLNTLNGEPKEKMRAILESCTSVEAMQRNYKSFLPEFLKVGNPQKKKLDEKINQIKFKGDAVIPLKEEADAEDSDLVEIRKLAHG